MWNFQFWVIEIRKKEFIAFQLVDERIAYQKTLLICILSKRKKKKGKKYSTEAFPIIFVSRKYMSCQLHSFPRSISLLLLSY